MATTTRLPDNMEERLQESLQTYKLNVGYAGLPQLPVGFTELVKKVNPHITELELSSNNLTDLPDDVCELRHIRILRLKYNQLKRLPSTVTRLPQLVTLELSGNQLTRLDSNIATMVQLKELDVSGNLLTELPQALGLLPKLEVLRLENNRLESLPENIGELPNLTKLDISTNCLRQLPSSMGRLKRIQRIDAANNMLVRVPPSMGYLKTIKELNLRYNNLDDKYKAKAEEGLSRLLAFLREEEERERLEEIERLRPVGTAVGPYMEYRCKAESSQTVKTEFGEFTVDNRCWVRTGYSMTQVNNMVYVFGGQLVKDGTVSNDLFWMTSERMEWHSQPTRGDRPCGRYGHVAVYDPDHHQLVVFGGRNADKKRLGDVAILDLDSFTWKRPTVNGITPSPREGAAAVYHAGHMVVFAGHATGGRTNDLLLLELSGWTWSQPVTSGTAPSPRNNAAITVANGHYLIIHGGRNNFVLDDLHLLDLLTRTWIEVTPKGTLPAPRHSHALHVHNDWVYLFGGINELGAVTVSLFKAYISRTAIDRAGALHAAANSSTTAGGPSGSAAGTVMELEWVELDSELPYNKNRTGVLHQGQLRCYQLGSAALGRSVNEDDAEKGIAFWDVFKIAKLDTFKIKPVVASELEGVSAQAQGSSKSIRVQHTTHSAGKMPSSFTINSAKEQKLLAYIADFQNVFEKLYPHRRPMPLTPLNECGVPKFICTTLRPSLPPFPELYTLEGCAKFVSEFLTYEPLEDPLHPPKTMPSPMSVLTWQTADPFDAAVVLCSLLLGAGYNAYVVLGYAPLAVTLNDQTNADCPFWQDADAAALTATAPAASTSNKRLSAVEASSTAAAAVSHAVAARASLSNGASARSSMAGAPSATNDEPGKQKKYQIRPKPQLYSKFLQEHGGSVAGTGPLDDPADVSLLDHGGTRLLAGLDVEDYLQVAQEQPVDRVNEVDVSAEQQQAEDGTEQTGQQKAAVRDNRVHAWVLLLPGRREVSEPLFVEPATGQRVSPTSPHCPYTGVEMIWSSANVWICMQMLEPHSDSRATPSTINWDLTNHTLWEPVLDDWQTSPSKSEVVPEPGRPTAAGSTANFSRTGIGSTLNANMSSVSSHMVGRPRTPSTYNLPRVSTLAAGGGTAGMTSTAGMAASLPRVTSRQLPPVGVSMAGTAALSSAGVVPGTPGANHNPRGLTEGGADTGSAAHPGTPSNKPGPGSEYARSEYARSEIGDGTNSVVGVADDQSLEHELLPDLPPSWVPKLSIPRDMLDMRCPRGSRTTIYKRCTHEIFAGFGECARWDGLVERITKFADDARHVAAEVWERFARRKDRLCERRSYPQKDAVLEVFLPGSLFAVKNLQTVRGERRIINFHSSARLDGLVRREEIFGSKLVEYFTGRDDRLEFRSATYGSLGVGSTAGVPAIGEPGANNADAAVGQQSEAPAAVQPSAPVAVATARNSSSGTPERPLPILKMSEKFSRNPAKSADVDVAKRVFHTAAGKTILQYHHAEGRLTAGYLVFFKDGPAQAVQVDPLAPKPQAQALLEIYKSLQAAEKEVLQHIRDSEWEGREIGRMRNNQEQSIALETPYYDICRVQADDSDDEPPDREATVYDYLLPFLPPGMSAVANAGGSSLTREQALAVRERCLKALKDRLIERANIIQARLDEEQTALTRRQASFARDRDALTAEEEEEYDHAVEEAQFKIGILQRRLANHEEAALRKYYDLDKKLRADSRLQVLLTPT